MAALYNSAEIVVEPPGIEALPPDVLNSILRQVVLPHIVEDMPLAKVSIKQWISLSCVSKGFVWCLSCLSLL
jgi:hypothetical protein